MVLDAPGSPLPRASFRTRSPQGELLLEVAACGVLPDLHVVDGELTEPKLPLVPGHQIVGRVVAGSSASPKATASACPGSAGRTGPAATAARAGRTSATTHASRAISATAATPPGQADDASFPDPRGFPDLQAAPLLCAGLIGYRSLRLAGDAERLGLYGFGASAHIVCQVARHQEGRLRLHRRRRAGVRARLGAGGRATRSARRRGADAAIIFAPAGELVPLRCARSPRVGPWSAPAST